MTASWAALDHVRASGIVLTLDGDEIRFAVPPGGVPRTVLEKIRTHKTELRALLAAIGGSSVPQPDPSDELLEYAVDTIQAVADKHPEPARRMEARFADHERRTRRPRG